MLDKKDFQAISDLMDKKIKESEARILHQAAQNTQVIIENTVGKQLQLLLEGQKLMMETLAPSSRVDALESEMDLAKSVLRSHSERINALEKKFA